MRGGGEEELTIMGQTALDLALDKGHNEIVGLLVQEGGKCLVVCEGKERKMKTHGGAGTS